MRRLVAAPPGSVASPSFSSSSSSTAVQLLLALVLIQLLPCQQVLCTDHSNDNDACPVDQFQEAMDDQQLTAGPAAVPEVPASLGPHRLAQLAGPLAIPRPVGSPGHRLVQRRIVDFLRSRLGDGWSVQLDAFAAETPLGERQFVNIIATMQTRRPTASGRRWRVLLAAHYDSKMLAAAGAEDFVGAIDSAVPCAMLLAVAEALTAAQAAPGSGGGGESTAVQLVFFDGEEAFERWTRADSLYGSRHLAQRWASEQRGGAASPGCPSASEIDALVLIDLVGGPDPRFYYSPHPGSSGRVVAKEVRLFERLVAMETALRAAGQLSERGRRHRYFQAGEFGSGLVQDDQLPFQEIGVATVHVIPQPFPAVWHSAADTLEAVQWDQAADVARILFAWLVERVGL